MQPLLAAGADVMVMDGYRATPLHSASRGYGTSANIQVLLDAGADAKTKDKYGKTPWDMVQINEKLEGTKGYWALNDARYN
jgi:hypothetical protein